MALDAQSRVGAVCYVFWPDDGVWYEALVRAHNPLIGRSNVLYRYDDDVRPPAHCYLFHLVICAWL
jgi:hypothetical protein